MEITKTLDKSKLTIALTGRLDTLTSPQLQSELDQSLNGIDELFLDMSALDYISSAGLRVLLSANKKMTAIGGSMAIANANSVVKEVFEITGFCDIFTIL